MPESRRNPWPLAWQRLCMVIGPNFLLVLLRVSRHHPKTVQVDLSTWRQAPSFAIAVPLFPNLDNIYIHLSIDPRGLRATLSPRLIRPLAAALLPQLVHLGHALLELDVLALLVAMSLVLKTQRSASVSRLLLLSRTPPREGGKRGPGILSDVPCTSTGRTTSPCGNGSAGSGGARSCLGRPAGAGHRASARASPLQELSARMPRNENPVCAVVGRV